MFTQLHLPTSRSLSSVDELKEWLRHSLHCVLDGMCPNSGCPGRSGEWGDDYLQYDLVVQHVSCLAYDNDKDKWARSNCEVWYRSKLDYLMG